MYDRFSIQHLIDLWLTEDIGACDLTVQLMIDADARGHFNMNARQPMIVAGSTYRRPRGASARVTTATIS